MGRTRLLLLLLLLGYIPGTPGLGVDTRTGAPESLSYAYGLAFLLPLIALSVSWKWPGIAARLALGSGALAVVLAGLDLTGVLAGPAPAGMVVLDLVVVVLGLAVAWTAWRSTRVAA